MLANAYDQTSLYICTFAYALRSQENAYKMFRYFVAAVTKQLGIHIPHQIMKRHLMHGITDSISFTNCHCCSL